MTSPSPASAPTEEDVARAWNAIADEFNQWSELGQDEKDSLAKFANALFAPILAEKERAEADARVFKINATSKLRSLEARTLAAEAALASAREAAAEIDRLLMNMQPHIPQALQSGRAGFIDNYVEAIRAHTAAIRAQGE